MSEAAAVSDSVKRFSLHNKRGSFRLNMDYIDLAASLDGGQAFRWFKDKLEGSQVWWRGVVGRCALRLCESKTGVNVLYFGDSGVEEIESIVKRYLSADLDLDEFNRLFTDDVCIGEAVRKFPGLHLLRQDPWECLVGFISSSVSNIPRIKLNMASIASLGDPVASLPSDRTFPSAEVVASLGAPKLVEMGLGFRARYIAEAAETVTSGSLSLEALRSETYENARRVLMSLKGVGGKIADCVLAFSLDKPEAFPVDRHVKRALSRWYGLPSNASTEYASEWARDRFQQWSALVQQYMFHAQRMSSLDA